MEVVYTGEEMPEKVSKSLFLAGPSLRPGQEKNMTSWRQDALKILEDKGFDGVVFSPEPRDMKFDKNFNYDNQIAWEEKYLNVADCIVFWIPRDISVDDNGNIKLGAFTTNIEWGTWANSGKVVYGAPKDADKNNYIDHYAKEFNISKGDNLTQVLDNAIEMVGEGAEREGGARYVPLFIWNLISFQEWYKSQIQANNRLEYAKLLYNFRPGNKNFIFLWILKVKMYISEEDRIKDNEFVLARPDISSVFLWKKNEPLEESEVVIIKEYRSPASNNDAFVRELPSGSAQHSNAIETAAEELYEETGLYLHPDRLKLVKSRQLAATLSSHKSHLYDVRLTDEELKWFKSQKNIVHGKEEDSERTFIEVKTVNELLQSDELDWSNLGMIYAGIYSK
jgi:8-oxo-dGTP pyrophosphatase MutT (NUDIX family)